MNNEGKDAALSREQVERYYAEVTSPDELGITDPRMKAVFDMALRAESLQAEVERLRADVLAGKILRDGLVNQCNDAERKLAEAVAALRKYGRHEEDCMFEMALNKHYKCTCGFDEATK
jgi:hypothetical protein